MVIINKNLLEIDNEDVNKIVAFCFNELNKKNLKFRLEDDLSEKIILDNLLMARVTATLKFIFGDYFLGYQDASFCFDSGYFNTRLYASISGIFDEKPYKNEHGELVSDMRFIFEDEDQNYVYCVNFLKIDAVMDKPEVVGFRMGYHAINRIYPDGHFFIKHL